LVTDPNEFKGVIKKIKDNIQKVIVGKSDVIDSVLISILCNGHVLVEDVPGSGKTTLARAVASSLDCSFGRIQFTPDLMPSDVVGVNWFNQKSSEFEFQSGPIFNQIILADEINRATPRTQSALLESMQETQVTVDGDSRSLPTPFIVLATQNPLDMEGTFPLPEAQLDRFLMKISLGYPSEKEESDIILRFHKEGYSENIQPVANGETIKDMEKFSSSVKVEENIRDYIISIVRATRENDKLIVGASPRGSLGLYKCSQANAALHGRDYVIPDDVKTLTNSVLSHRIIPTSNARLRGFGGNEILEEIVSEIPVPMEVS
jgi:MoxR-like ATPase|tara:strand:+ start:1264 stop:2220 length:957 start_codon:yes stop_codon:yes gene_type:complete